MIRLLSINILKFLILVLIQVLILNPINIGDIIHPVLYILFLITLPFNTPRWLMLVLGFFTGLIIDIFSDTLGVHAASSTFLAFAIPIVWKLMAPHDGYEQYQHPQIDIQGVKWFFNYVVTTAFIFNLTFFLIEAFDFNFFFSSLWQAIVNTAFTVLLIFLSQMFIVKK